VTSTAPPTGHLPSPWRTYLRRGAAPVVLGVLLGVLVAGALLAVLPKQYTAAAKVLVQDTGVGGTASASGSRTTGDINLDTEAQLVTSAAVIQEARSNDPELSRFGLNKLIGRIAITVPPNSTVLQIAFTDNTAQHAADAANAFANAYLDVRRSTAKQQLQSQIDLAKGKLGILQSNLSDEITSLAAQKPQSPQKAVLNVEITQTKNQLTYLNGQITQLQSVQVTPGQLTSPANPPHHASSPSKTLYLASGFAVGLLLGLLLAWLRVHFRRIVRTVDDLGHVVDAPCVAVFRRADPTAVGALAAYRHLTVVVSTVVAPPARIVVTSPLHDPECSEVAAGLAAALTRRGLTSAVLQVHGDEIDAPQLPSVPTSRVLDADDVFTAADPSLPAALDRIRGDRAMLIIDAPGATVTTDGQVMGAEADAVIVVITARTRSRRVRQVIAGLDSVGAPILGTVLVERNAAKRGSGRADRRRAAAADEAAEAAAPADDRDPADVVHEPSSWPDEHSLPRTPPANGHAGSTAAARRGR
jgi:capsular polysaccharide biosynthesis protein